jgi:SAM-dependent methyltransferase
MSLAKRCISCKGLTHLIEESRLQCEKCGLLMAENMDTLDYSSSYSNDESIYGKHIKLLNHFQSRVNPLAKLIPFESRIIKFLQNDNTLRKIVDLGCGTGRFLRAAEYLGLTATGFEVAPILVQELKRHGRNVYQGGINEFLKSDINSDVISLLEVVEHLSEPKNEIVNILELKHPKFLFIVVPEWQIRRRFDKNFEAHDHPPNHLTWWNKESVSKLLSHPDYDVSIEEIPESRRSLLGHAYRNKFDNFDQNILQWMSAFISPPSFWLLGIAHKK